MRPIKTLAYFVLAIAALAVLAFTATGRAAEPYTVQYSGTTITDQDVGRAIYNARCETCHGLHGEGTKGHQLPATAPPLQGNQFIVYAPDTAIAEVIRNGRTGAKRHYDDTYPDMPSFDATMIQDLRPLIAYLKGDMQKGK
ncbi:MAG TPA: cytochrome c [Gammaproteobacteria bacterium]|jgi:mono/diheme cytochrome c family protein|nr:cytochrome c [Gammaproteobacteria bacterium]